MSIAELVGYNDAYGSGIPEIHLSTGRSVAPDMSALRLPQETIGPEYGRWKLVRTFTNSYYAVHDTHGRFLLDAHDNAQAIARFRAFLRRQGVRP